MPHRQKLGRKKARERKAVKDVVAARKRRKAKAVRFAKEEVQAK